jgi:hypothetical protein
MTPHASCIDIIKFKSPTVKKKPMRDAGEKHEDDGKFPSITWIKTDFSDRSMWMTEFFRPIYVDDGIFFDPIYVDDGIFFNRSMWMTEFFSNDLCG